MVVVRFGRSRYRLLLLLWLVKLMRDFDNQLISGSFHLNKFSIKRYIFKESLLKYFVCYNFFLSIIQREFNKDFDLCKYFLTVSGFGTLGLNLIFFCCTLSACSGSNKNLVRSLGLGLVYYYETPQS